MARPLIATKLYVPKLRRGLVTRPRLIAHLRRGAEARLTLVSAPAGFGKTTLLADWLGETPDGDRSVAWLSLDPADNEPSSFWTYVVTALQGAVPSVGSSALELITSSPLPTDLVLTTLLNELAAAPGEVWLVLDDYHLVDNHEVDQGLTFLLEHLPPHVHVVLSTRADPDLPLARWRAARRAGRDPCRRPAVHLRRGRRLPQRGDGTAPRRAGRRGPGGTHRGVDRRAAARRALAPGARRRQRLHRPVRRERPVHRRLPRRGGAGSTSLSRCADFLLHSAVLDRLTGPLCDAVTGRDDGSQHAQDPGARQPVPRRPGRPAGVVPLPPPVRRRAAGAPAQRAAGAGSAAAPARQPVVRAPRSDRGVGQARTGGAGLRPRGPPHRAGRVRRSDVTGRKR